MNRNTCAAVIFAFVIGSGAGALCMKLASAKEKKNDSLDIVSVISEMDSFLKDKGITYEDNIENTAKIMNGYLSVYDDIYTYYYNDYEPGSRESIALSFNGFPLAAACKFSVKWVGDDLVVRDVDEAGKAYACGLREGDIIASIDGTKREDSDEKYPRLMYGDDGTICHIVVDRDGELVDIELERENAEINDGVDTKMIGDVLYLRISRFDNTTDISVSGDIVNAGKFDKLIIDLRDNGGGDAQSTVDVAGHFVNQAYTTLYGYDGDVEVVKSNTTCDYNGIRIVVLVNDHTASSAETMTALLKQFGDTQIVGTNTFGKGIFQRSKRLSNGGILNYTAGYYTVGEWECYHKKGIEPDIEVEMDRALIGTDDDIQLQKALEILR